MQESLHLQITKLIVRQDQPVHTKSFKKQQTNLLSLQTRHTVHAGLLCYALYISGFSSL